MTQIVGIFIFYNKLNRRQNSPHSGLDFLSSGEFTSEELDFVQEDAYNDFADEEIIQHEGYLYRISTKKIKKYWFKLINRDLYCNNISKFSRL